MKAKFVPIPSDELVVFFHNKHDPGPYPVIGWVCTMNDEAPYLEDLVPVILWGDGVMEVTGSWTIVPRDELDRL